MSGRRMGRIRNAFIRRTAQVGPFGGKVRQASLRWFGLELRRNSKYVGRGMLWMELQRRGMSSRRFMDAVREEDAYDRKDADN